MKIINKNITDDWLSFIEPIANRLLDFSKRNPLYNIDSKSNLFLLENEIDFDQTEVVSLESSKELLKILKKHRFIRKETGLNTLYISYGVYEIGDDGLRLPFYLVPIELKKNSDNLNYSITLNWQDKVINPLLQKVLKDKFDLVIDENEVPTKEAYLGIFNYKKYVILDEILSIQKEKLSNPLKKLYDFNPKENESTASKLCIDDSLVADADHSQRIIIEKSLTGSSFCVQGPPGTGKSQTITNIISANLKLGKKILFLSEKKAAIDVVAEKLKESNLESNLTKITDSKNDKKDFISSLEKQWKENKKKEEGSIKRKNYEAELNRVQSYYDNLYRNRPELGDSISNLLEGKTRVSIDSNFDRIPALSEWKILQPLFNNLLGDIQKEIIAETDLKGLLCLNASLIEIKDFEEKIQLHGAVVSKGINQINKVINFSNFEIETLSELTRFVINARIISGLKYKEKIDILREPSKEKKFISESKKYFKLKTETENLLVDLRHWKEIPSKETLDFFQNHLDKGSFFSSKKREATKLFQKLASNNLKIDKLDLFKKTYAYFEVQKKLNTSLARLKSEFKILNPNTEIDELNAIISKATYNQKVFNILLEQEKEFIQQLDDLNPILDKIQHSKRILFSIKLDSFSALESLSKSILNSVNYVLKKKEELYILKNISSETLHFILNFNGDLRDLDLIIFKLNIEKTIEKSSILNDSSLKSINFDIKSIISKRKENYKNSSIEIIKALKSNFLKLEDLLITPAARLSEERKKLKKEVRVGKRILTHEFSKTKQFKSIRSLCETEPKHWIFKMKNVWMMNPLSVSEILPFEKESFDLLIIDEASQIPEEDIIPALFRAKQVIVVGDKMQMPPSNFFSGTEVGPSILDVANYRLENFMLKWHYRSKNPQLIAFSNQMFYDSELILSPSISKNEQVLEFKYVQDSNYLEGSNPKEAKEIIDFLEKEITLWNEKTICIATLSLSQQKTIEKAVSNSKLKKIFNQKIETEKLIIRNLENLQGDECDLLLIGTGYGPNETGKLAQNFGVLSKNGGHNRLNVLITRAREKVVLFSSFQPDSIKLTDNEGVNYLKEYMEFIQSTTSGSSKTIEKLDFLKLKKDEEVEKEHNLYLVSKKGQDFRSSAIILNPFSTTNIEIEIEELLSRVSILQQIGLETKVIDFKNLYYLDKSM